MNYEEREDLSKRKIAMQVYMPFSIVDVLDRLAAFEGTTANQIALRLIRRGMAIERDERAAKAGQP